MFVDDIVLCSDDTEDVEVYLEMEFGNKAT